MSTGRVAEDTLSANTLFMPERFPRASSPGPRQNDWGKRVVTGAALLAGLGGAWKHRSNARRQDALHALAPGRPPSSDRGRIDGRAAVPGPESVWNRLWQPQMDVPDEVTSSSAERPEISREEAKRIGREVYEQFVADGGLAEYRGHYPEFNDEISIRLARRFGRAYSLADEVFRWARADIDDALGREADRLYGLGEAHVAQGDTIRAAHEFEASTQTEMLINPASGVNAAVEAGSGHLIVQSLRQYHSAETDGPSPWIALIPGDSPREAAEGLDAAWSWMNEEERRIARARVQAMVDRLEGLIEDARTGTVREDDRERVARLPAILAEWERLLARLIP